MPRKPPAPGTPVAAIGTPALLIDLDAFERNLRVMADDVERYGVRLRPHAKTHKSPDIARRQIAQGAVGCCCQTVREAEVLVDGGVNDVLVTNQVVGDDKISRLVRLAQRAEVGVCVDDETNVRALGAAAAAAGASLRALVEVEVGMRRCGVPPGEPAAELARRVGRTPGLRFGGIQAYHGGAQHIRSYVERGAAIERAVEYARATLAAIAAAGLECATVTGAGTGTYPFEAASGLYNELQAGSYIFMDADYADNRMQDDTPFDRFQHSLFVLCSVVSVRPVDGIVVDAGLKAHSVDSGLPRVTGVPGASYTRASDEHGNIELDGSVPRPALGDKIRLIPGHCDPTVNLYDWYIGIRDDRVESCWPVAARGPGN